MARTSVILSILWLLSTPLSLADEAGPIRLVTSIVRGTEAKIVVTNQSDKPQWIHNSLRHSSDEVPDFSWLKFKDKNGSLIPNNQFEDGRWSPKMPSSRLATSEDYKMLKLEPGNSVSIQFPLGKFLNRAPVKCRLGFDSVKFICRIYTRPFSEYIESESEWVQVDAPTLWRQRTY